MDGPVYQINFTSVDRFQARGMGGILAKEANVLPLKLMNPCLLAIEVVWDVSSLEVSNCHLTGM